MKKEVIKALLDCGFSISSKGDGAMVLNINDKTILPLGPSARQILEQRNKSGA